MLAVRTRMRGLHAMLLTSSACRCGRDVGVEDGRVRLEARGAPEVLREQRHRIEAADRTRLSIGHQRGRTRYVEVEGEREGEQLADHDTVDWRPVRDLGLGEVQRAVFGRK